MTRRQIEIVTSEEPPTCPRCGNDGLLLARIPHGWINAGGTRVQGRTGVILCADCHAEEPHAAPLITWFHVHGQVEVESSEEFVRLLAAWAEDVAVPTLDERELNSEIEQWKRGDL